MPTQGHLKGCPFFVAARVGGFFDIRSYREIATACGLAMTVVVEAGPSGLHWVVVEGWSAGAMPRALRMVIWDGVDSPGVRWFRKMRLWNSCIQKCVQTIDKCPRAVV